MADSRHEPRFSTDRVLVRIAEAAELTDAAEKAWDLGDEHARALYDTAEQAHGRVLNLICSLSEQDADRVEPPFTAFEHRLLRLGKRILTAQPS